MDYVSALVPPAVMAVAFTALVVTIIKNQGGANQKEDAYVDSVLARAEEEGTAQREAGTVSGAPAGSEHSSGA